MTKIIILAIKVIASGLTGGFLFLSVSWASFLLYSALSVFTAQFFSTYAHPYCFSMFDGLFLSALRFLTTSPGGSSAWGECLVSSSISSTLAIVAFSVISKNSKSKAVLHSLNGISFILAAVVLMVFLLTVADLAGRGVCSEPVPLDKSQLLIEPVPLEIESSMNGAVGNGIIDKDDADIQVGRVWTVDDDSETQRREAIAKAFGGGAVVAVAPPLSDVKQKDPGTGGKGPDSPAPVTDIKLDPTLVDMSNKWLRSSGKPVTTDRNGAAARPVEPRNIGGGAKMPAPEGREVGTFEKSIFRTLMYIVGVIVLAVFILFIKGSVATICGSAENYKVYVTSGQFCMDKNKPEMALREFNKAIQIFGQSAESYFRRGTAYEAMGNRDLAVADYTKAIELDPKFQKAYLHRGLCLVENKKMSGAEADLVKALEFDPANAEGLYALGQCKYAKGDYESAIKLYTKCVELNGKFIGAYQSIGNAYFHLRNFKEAIYSYTKEININPRVPKVYYNRGHLYYRDGLLEEALADFNSAIALDATYADAYLHKADLCNKMGLKDEAIEAYQGFIKYTSMKNKEEIDYARSRINELYGNRSYDF